MTDESTDSNMPVVSETAAPLVVRSQVPATNNYRDYKPALRKDFFRSCAYCTMTEAEAQAIRFTIDHYEPRAARPELECDYSNLMYCCDECNARKGDQCPPEAARERGDRFFRIDQETHQEHVELDGVTLKEKTRTGFFNIQALDLNRAMLQTLRDIRERVTECDEYVAGGVLALKNFPIDQLPPHIRGRAINSIRQATRVADVMALDIERILQEFATSPLIDADDDTPEHQAERKKKLKAIKALDGDNWRARRSRG